MLAVDVDTNFVTSLLEDTLGRDALATSVRAWMEVQELHAVRFHMNAEMESGSVEPFDTDPPAWA